MANVVSRSTWVVVVFGFLAAGQIARGADDEAKRKGSKSPFAQGKKLPGDLSDLLDANDDGAITDAEAKQAARQFQKEASKNTERGKAILDALDKDDDGKVDEQEAAEGVARGRMNDGGAGQRTAKMFSDMDKNTDGFIDLREFDGWVKNMGPVGRFIRPRLGQFFTNMDGDRDKRISVVESQFAVDYFAKQARLKQDKKDAADKHLLLAKATLSKLDRDEDGKVSEKEARKDRNLDKVFDKVDTDQDKQVTVDEMYKYLKEKLPNLK